MPAFLRADPGQPLRIPAADYNAMLDAARAYQRLGDQGGELAGYGVRPTLTVLVRNDTGGDLGEFCPVRLGATLIVPLATLPYEAADQPAFVGLACDGAGVHAITQEAIPADEMGRVVVQGVCVARVPSGAAAGSYAQPPATGNAGLAAGGGFARLVTAAAASGSLTLAVVQIGGGSGEAGAVVVRTTAANDGTQWSAAVVQKFSNTGVASDDTETVDVQPVNGVAAASGERFFARDTGGRSPSIGETTPPYTGVRRLRLERVGGSGSVPATGTVTFTTYRYTCSGGSLAETPTTHTITGPGLSGS